MRLVDADTLAMKLRHMGYMDKNEEVQEVIDRFAEERDGDLISRQAAIRWVKTECNPYGKPTLEFESGKKVIEHLKQMPSAQSEQKKGKWLIAEKDRYIVHSVRCSVCGYCISWMANYCPNCGAKMEGEQE